MGIERGQEAVHRAGGDLVVLVDDGEELLAVEAERAQQEGRADGGRPELGQPHRGALGVDELGAAQVAEVAGQLGQAALGPALHDEVAVERAAHPWQDFVEAQGQGEVAALEARQGGFGLGFERGNLRGQRGLRARTHGEDRDEVAELWALAVGEIAPQVHRGAQRGHGGQAAGLVGAVAVADLQEGVGHQRHQQGVDRGAMGLGQGAHGVGRAGQLVVAHRADGVAVGAALLQHDHALATVGFFLGLGVAPPAGDAAGPLPPLLRRHGRDHRGRFELARQDGLAIEAAQDGAQHLHHRAAVADDVVHREHQRRLRGVRQEARAPGQAALQRDRLVHEAAVEGFERVARGRIDAGLHPVAVVEELRDAAVVVQDAHLVGRGRGHDGAAHAREGAGQLAQGLAHQGFVQGLVEAQDVGLVDRPEVALAGPVHVFGAVEGDEVGGGLGDGVGGTHNRIPAAMCCIASNGPRSTVRGL